MTVEASSRLTLSMLRVMAPCRSCVRCEYPGRQCSGSDLPRGCVCKGLLQSAANPGANRKSISHRYHPILVAFVWELTKETIHLPLGCLQGGLPCKTPQETSTHHS